MILLLNGSGKSVNSNSQFFLNIVKEQLEEEIKYIQIMPDLDMEPIVNNLEQTDCIVFAMPLYVDGVPAPVLQFMYQLETYMQGKDMSDTYLYVMGNCGFYEGRQNAILIHIMKNWCKKTGMKWGQGIGIGSGEMFGAMREIPLGKGPTKNLKKGLEQFVRNIKDRKSVDEIYVEPNMVSQGMFLMVANKFWDMQAKKNGVKKKTLSHRMVRQ